MSFLEDDSEIRDFPDLSFGGGLPDQDLELLVVADLDRSDEAATVAKKLLHRHRKFWNGAAVDDGVEARLPGLEGFQDQVGGRDMVDLPPLHDPGQRRPALDSRLADVEDVGVGGRGDDAAVEADHLGHQRVDVSTLAADDQDIHSGVELNERELDTSRKLGNITAILWMHFESKDFQGLTYASQQLLVSR